MIDTDISLAREFQKHLSEPTHAHVLIDHGKDSKRSSKLKWTEREYHVQDRTYVQHQLVKIFICFNAVPSIIILCYTCRTPFSDRVD